MEEYILKDGRKVSPIPIGKSSVKIGEVNPSGFLTVCGRGPINVGNNGATVICKCKCGNYTMIALNAFRSGTTRSCGCYAKKQKQEMCKENKKKLVRISYEDYNILNEEYIKGVLNG